MNQVQTDRSLVFDKLTYSLTNDQLVNSVKFYLLGIFGIPLDNQSLIPLFKQLEIVKDFVCQGFINRQNFIKIFIKSLDCEQNHKKGCAKPDYNKIIKQYLSQVQIYLGFVSTNEFYFQNLANSKNIPYYGGVFDMMDDNCECNICTLKMNPEQSAFLECTHIFHVQCLYQHIKCTIQAGGTIIKCPNQKCGVELSYQEMLNFMTPEMETKYHEFQMNKYVESHGDCTSWCPTPNCNAIFEFERGVTLYACKRCLNRYCLKCRSTYHQGRTCQQYRDYIGMSQDDRAFTDFARGAKFKQCPRCRFWVQRNQGCPTMRCRCSQQFCYDCGGTTCPHGSCSKVMNNARI